MIGKNTGDGAGGNAAKHDFRDAANLQGFL